MISSAKGLFRLKDTVRIFNLNMYEWLPKKDILIGLIASTILINILTLMFPLSLLQIYDRIIPYQATSTLFYLILAVCVAMLLEMFIKLARNYVSAWGDAKLGYKSANRAFDHLLNAKLDDYEKVGPGVHLDRINSLNRVKDFYGGQAVTTILDLPFVIVFLILIAFIMPIMVFVPLSIQLGILLISSKHGQTVFETLKKRSDTNEKKLNYIVEVLSGIHTIKAQGMEQLMLRRYERLQNSSAFDDFDFAQINAAHNRLGNLLSQINLVGIVFVGAVLVLYQQMTPGGVAACIMLSSRCMMPFVKAMNLWSRFQSIKLAEAKSQEILNLPQELPSDTMLTDIKTGHLELRNVSFGYGAQNNDILSNVQLSAKPGETIHLDSDGALGKTTTLLLIKGLLRPHSGTVLIDGKPLNDYAPETLGSQLAYIPQDGILFQGTILENLTLFRDAQYAQKAKEICESLDLDSVIEQMPQGYQTLLGQGSVDFVSKGIKQRILIVRSLVDSPKIVLFDESNSAMDLSSDRKLKGLLEELSKTSTLILVSHRPSIANLAKRQIVLANQKLSEKGA